MQSSEIPPPHPTSSSLFYHGGAAQCKHMTGYTQERVRRKMTDCGVATRSLVFQMRIITPSPREETSHIFCARTTIMLASTNSENQSSRFSVIAKNYFKKKIPPPYPGGLSPFTTILITS
eukprot:scaffold17794_cov74-Cylindrotheca_fusiformis.AAC.1